MVQKIKFKDIDIDSPFFDSLKESYPNFDYFFDSHSNKSCYCVFNNDVLTDLLYIKKEINGFSDDIYPKFNENILKLKIGIFKCSTGGVSHLFMHKIFDKAIIAKVKFIYITFYSNKRLSNYLEKYGFRFWGKKGDELVYIFKK